MSSTLVLLALLGQLSNGPPPDVGGASKTGTSGQGARANHTHKGVRRIYQAGSYTTGASGDIAIAVGGTCTMAEGTDTDIYTGVANKKYTISCTGAGGTAHNILSGTHTDTAGAGAEARGDLVIRNNSSQWTRLPKGAAGTVLHGSTTDPAYSAVLTSELSGTISVAQGGTGVAAAGDDQVLVGNGSTFVTTTLPQCSAAGYSLLYDQVTNTFACDTPAKPLPKIAGLPKLPCNPVRRTNCQ